MMEDIHAEGRDPGNVRGDSFVHSSKLTVAAGPFRRGEIKRIFTGDHRDCTPDSRELELILSFNRHQPPKLTLSVVSEPKANGIFGDKSTPSLRPDKPS